MTALKEIRDDKFVAILFRKLARQKEILRASFYGGDKKIRSHMYFADLKGEEPKITWDNNGHGHLTNQKATVAFLNKGTFFQFEANIKRSVENVHDLEKPLAVYSAFRRILPRYKMEDTDNGHVCLWGDSRKYQIADISTQGLSFRSCSFFLHKEEVLRSVVVALDGIPDVCVDSVVSYCRSNKDGTFFYGLRFVDIDWASRQQLLAYIFRKNYPCIRFQDELSEAQLHEIYDRAGYLSLKSSDEMTKNYEDMVKIYRKTKHNAKIGATLAYCDETKILTVGSVLRIYDYTFLGHQLASLPEARLNLKSKSDVYSSIADFLVDHQDFRNYVTYFDIHLSWHHEMYEKIGQYINDRKKFVMDSLEFFECNARDFKIPPTRTGFSVSVLDHPEPFIRYCSHSMEPLEQICYSYDYDNFYLPETKKVYEALGLFASRRLWSVSHDGKIVAFAVGEVYTSGLNLFNLLDMVRIYFYDRTIDSKPVIEALLPHVIQFFSRYDKDTFYTVFKVECGSPASLEMPGFTHRHSAGRVMANRHGVAEYRAIMGLFAR